MVVGRPFLALADDLKTRFEKSYIPEPNSGCWLWLENIDDKGYGRITISRTYKMHYAHRVSWFLYRGIPSGNVLHHCDIACCVNPDHLYIGTHKQNAQDRVRRGRSADQRGQKSHRAKLTNEQVLAIRNDTRPQKEIAAAYGITQSTVSVVKNQKTWRNV